MSTWAKIVVLAVVATVAVGCGADAVTPTEEVPHSVAEPWGPVPFAIDASPLAAAEQACRQMQPPAGVTL